MTNSVRSCWKSFNNFICVCKYRRLSPPAVFLSVSQIKIPADFTLPVNCFLKLFLCLVDRAEQLHLLFDGSLDSLEAGCEKLSGVEALALEILACLDVLSGSVSESELALGVDVDLGNAEGDSDGNVKEQKEEEQTEQYYSAHYLFSSSS